MNIKFSIYFVNHLDKKIKLDSKIVDVEDGILEQENTKLFNTLTFTVNDVYIDSTIVGDLIERIEVKYQIDDNEKISDYFVIDSIEFLKNNNIKIYSKSKTVEYSYKYSGNKNELIQASSLKVLLDKILPNTILNYTNLTDANFTFDYEIKEKSIEEVVEELQKITLFDYYYHQGSLYFEDKKSIQVDDVSVQRFTSLKDILEFNTSTNKDDKKINKIFINTTEQEVVFAEPIITLDLKDSPQCCSPDEVIIFEDDDKTYKISPVNAFYIVYFSPLTQLPTINMDAQSGDRVLIENYQLEKDYFVRLAGGIKELIAVEGVENYHYEPNYNLLTFDKVDKGELKITYKTTVLHGSISHQKYPTEMNITIQYFNQLLEHTHKIEMKGYYPIPYTLTVSLVSDWGIDYNNAIGGSVKVGKKYDDNDYNYVEDLEVDDFGEFKISFDEYGSFSFTRKNQETLYLDYYINKKKFYMEKVA